MLNQAIYDSSSGISCPDDDPYIKRAWLDSLGDTLFLTRCRTSTISRNELNNFVKQH